MLANPWSVNPVKPPICVRKLSKKIAVSERLLGKLSLWELKIKPVLQIGGQRAGYTWRWSAHPSTEA